MGKTVYICSECDYRSPAYFGKCPSCGMWGTLEETREEKSSSSPLSSKETEVKAIPLSRAKERTQPRIQTSMDEFNRVMGGGIVGDSVSILTAKPGAGKSTLLLQVAGDLVSRGKKVLYASGEESESQILQRADRIGVERSQGILLLSTTGLHHLLQAIDEEDPDVIILDSVQTFSSREFTSRSGSPTQVMAVASALVEKAKGSRPRTVFIVGQMTKQDELAGVRTLEHLVDTVLRIEGESTEELRTFYSTKNRFGATGEMGFFRMTEKGLVSLDNPSEFFMTARSPGQELPGCGLTILREGSRPIVVEVEALVSPSIQPYPTRLGDCVRKDHLHTLISILEERGGCGLYNKNVVVKTTGNIPLREPAANLALIMAVASSMKGIPIPSGVVFCADVGLTGELKKVPHLSQRIQEARRMGFQKIITAPLGRDVHRGGEDVVEQNTLKDVMETIFRYSDEKIKI